MSKLKNDFRDYLKKHPRNFGLNILKKEKFTCVDVGAANWLPPHLMVLDGLAHIVLFEPHKESYDKLEKKIKSKSNYFDSYEFLNIGLSRNGGNTILYMLNAPTGSSIIPVDLEKCDPNDSYIFPIKEVEIETKSLKQVFENSSFDMIKLDVQGAELEILLGAGKDLLDDLLCFEMEVAFFDTIYKGAPNTQQVINEIKNYGFELFDLNLCRNLPLNTEIRKLYDTPNSVVNGKLVETDMLFFKAPKYVLDKRSNAISRKYIVALCIYNMFAHAEDFAKKCETEKIFTSNELKEIIDNINGWMSSFNPSILDKIINKLNNIFRLGMWSKETL